MLRTIKNVVDMTADTYKVPYLKIDLMYEETGIEVVPSVPDINDIYHKIIDDVSISRGKWLKISHFFLYIRKYI
jgi:hypothetical protein